MNKEEIVIDESNFDQYFFDARSHQPKKGQVLAEYRAMAELIDGDLKREIIKQLTDFENGSKASVNILQKAINLTEKDAIRVTKEMLEDLLSGMTEEEIAQKSYIFPVKYFYYTEKENIPSNDKHWSSISLIDVREEFTDDDLDKLLSTGTN